MALKQAPIRQQDEGLGRPGRAWKSSAPSEELDMAMLQGQIRRVVIFCHDCGYGVGAVPPGGVCPKCGKSSWETNVIRQRLVAVHESS
jgi:rubrerythrin